MRCFSSPVGSNWQKLPTEMISELSNMRWRDSAGVSRQCQGECSHLCNNSWVKCENHDDLGWCLQLLLFVRFFFFFFFLFLRKNAGYPRGTRNLSTATVFLLLLFCCCFSRVFVFCFVFLFVCFLFCFGGGTGLHALIHTGAEYIILDRQTVTRTPPSIAWLGCVIRSTVLEVKEVSKYSVDSFIQKGEMLLTLPSFTYHGSWTWAHG